MSKLHSASHKKKYTHNVYITTELTIQYYYQCIIKAIRIHIINIIGTDLKNKQETHKKQQIVSW